MVHPLSSFPHKPARPGAIVPLLNAAPSSGYREEHDEYVPNILELKMGKKNPHSIPNTSSRKKLRRTNYLTQEILEEDDEAKSGCPQSE